MLLSAIIAATLLHVPLTPASIDPPPADDENEVVEEADESEIERDNDLLRGPSVPDRGLVRVDFRGNFQPVEGRPVLAAIAMLDDLALNEAARKAADARLVELSEFLLDEIELLRDATDATREGERDEARKFYRQLWDRFDPDHIRDPLLGNLHDVMTEQQAAEVQTLLDDYWNAFYDWELRNTKQADESTRRRTQDALSFAIFQRELQQAYRISLQPIAATLERIYAAANPTEDQKHEIRNIVIAYVKKHGNNPSAEARTEVSTQIYESLDDDQRRKFLDALIWQR